MQCSGLLLFSALSTAAAFVAQDEVAALQSETRYRKLEADVLDVDTAVVSQNAMDSAVVEQSNSSQCHLQDAVYDAAGHMLYSNDACAGQAMPELAREDVQDPDPWSLVKQWTSQPVTADTDPRDLLWRESPPSVACIAVLPSDQGTLQRVQRIVDNFTEQTYEGRMQLVIVANDDRDSEEALASFVDGVNIKALHVAMDRMDLAALYRLGVAEADNVDVLARWDWDAWHHHHRLDRQIRSMALMSRPASRLRTWTTTKEGSEVPRQEVLGEPTLVGEKEWMKRYWYPGQHKEQLQATNSSHFVELDLPKLVVFGSASSSDNAFGGSVVPDLSTGGAQDPDPWSLVKQWTSRSVTSDTGSDHGDLEVATVAEDEARKAAFSGDAPAVACITVLPSGQDTFQLVRHLVDNFVEQTYEGSMQLIIVADNSSESEEALANFVDGVNIKVSYAAVDRMDLAALYRLGAADADDVDILARWDWDAWHHRHRLALQIRSMALTSRPASRLRTWTTTKEGSEVPQQEGLGEPTLVGEKEWMKRYWYPGQHEKQLRTTHSSHFVELNLPKLVIFGLAGSMPQ